MQIPRLALVAEANETLKLHLALGQKDLLVSPPFLGSVSEDMHDHSCQLLMIVPVPNHNSCTMTMDMNLISTEA